MIDLDYVIIFNFGAELIYVSLRHLFPAENSTGVISSKKKFQALRLPQGDYCLVCTGKQVEEGGKLSGLKERINQLLKSNNIGVDVRFGLPST